MKWYTGGIAEAITYSKSKGAVFVVYIYGTDEKSQKITELIDNGELGQKFEQDCFVAVKLEGGSLPHLQFSEIYKEPTIPSIYLIGKSGVPLDIITGNDNLDNVCQKIDNTLSRAGIHTSTVTSVPATVSSDNFIKNELASESSRVVCDNDVLKIVDGKNVEGDTSKTEENENLKEDKEEKQTDVKEDAQKENIKENDKPQSEEVKEQEKPETSKDLSAEEKIQRAKELIDLKRQQKENEEKENERQKELERRKMGQSVQELKKWQEDQELKQLKEEREREKRENQLARERVLAQIAQDRAERQSKSQSTSPPVSEPSKPSQSPPKVASNKTRLQFKLPDGSSTTQEFDNSDTLENVVLYIRSNLPLPFRDFTLSTVFPRREFTPNDYSQTLTDLQLIPTAVVLILPFSSGPVSHSAGGTLNALIWSLLAPIISIFDYLKCWVFGSNSNSRTQKRPSPDEPSESQRYSNPKRKATDGSTVVRRQGNIHRLSDNNDSDDENNTWNGNSTQQM